MKSLGKFLRFLLYIVIFVVFCIAFALIVSTDFNAEGNLGDNAFSEDFLSCIFCEIGCLVGSIFFILGYDILYREGAEKKGFFQKVFIAIGLIFTLFFGALGHGFYIGKFDEAQAFSPWVFAAAAPALMAQLLTLLLYETIVKDCHWLIKFIVPFASFIVCYFVYVILGYIGSSSAFVYGGIGLIICAGLLVALIVLTRKRKNDNETYTNTKPANQNYQPPVFNKKDFLIFETKKIDFDSLNWSNYRFYAKAKITRLDDIECKVEVVLYAHERGMSRESIPVINEYDTQIKKAQREIKSWFDQIVQKLSKKYTKEYFSLDIKTEMVHDDN